MTSQAAANSGLHLQAARITSPPSRAKSRPSLRACVHASKATRLAAAPGALPHGCPKVPPPNCKQASSHRVKLGSYEPSLPSDPDVRLSTHPAQAQPSDLNWIRVLLKVTKKSISRGDFHSDNVRALAAN